MAEFSVNTEASTPNATMDYSANWDKLADLSELTNAHSAESELLKKEPLIQRFFYRYLQLTGIYPRSISRYVVNTKAVRCGKPTIEFPINLWLLPLSAGATLISVVGYLSFLIETWENSKKQMAKLEFFTLVNFIFTIFDFVQGPLTLIFMVWNSQKLIPLVTAVEEFLYKVITFQEIKKIRLVACFCVAWHVICILGIVTSFYEYSSSYIKNDPTHPNWTSLTHYPSQDWPIVVPMYLVLIWNIASMILTFNCQMVLQYLLIILVIAITRACSRIKHNIEILSERSVTEYQLSVLRQARGHFRRVKGLMNQMNDFFSLIVLVSCFRDLVTCISFIATLLARLDKEEDESNNEFLDRFNDQKASLVFVYSQSAIGFVNGVYRLTVLLCCYGQESAIRKKIQCIQANVTDDAVDEECNVFLSEFSGTVTAMSGGGFFHVTKEYLAAMIGLLFTYMLLIYQTHDSKGDMNELIKSKEFKARLKLLSVEFHMLVSSTFEKCSKG